MVVVVCPVIIHLVGKKRHFFQWLSCGCCGRLTFLCSIELCFEACRLGQGPLKQMDGIATKCWFSKWTLGRMTLAFQKLWRYYCQIWMTKTSDQQKKHFVGVSLLLPTFPPSRKWPFLAIFHNTDSRNRTDFNHAFHFESFMM